MKRLITLCILISSINVFAQLPALKISDNKRFIQTEDGKPFFWTADTAWELFHKLSKEEAAEYLAVRSKQGFNVVQAVMLAELDGLRTPNANGDLPFKNLDKLKPNVPYFKHIEEVIELAEKQGIYVALLPTWGDKVFKDKWGEGPEIFNKETAYEYGKWISLRFRGHSNIVWVLGGDRNPREGTEDVEVWRAMAKGLKDGFGYFGNALITFHPQPASPGGSSNWFHTDEWLSFNMHQTGHCPDQPVYTRIINDYGLQPIKPTIDGEPLYEDHPNCFDAKHKGYSVAGDIRKIMYWNVFSGAAGQTYGCHDVWQMYKADGVGVNGPLRPYNEALQLPMATQMKNLKNLMLSRPYFDRIPDQQLIENKQEENGIDYVAATRDDSGTYAFIYIPTGKPVIVNTKPIKSDMLGVWWYDPRTGATFFAGQVQNYGSFNAVPPSAGDANDWVLVIDDAKKGYERPGTVAY